MQEIDLQFRTMFAELVQRSLDDRFLKDFLPDGSFVRVPVKGRDYWYYTSAMQDGKRSRRYVGPASDPAITQRVEEFSRLKSSTKNRRLLVSALNRIGLPGPDNFTGNIIEGLSNAGLFRLRGVLVGTVAFQSYAGMLGVRLPNASMQTGDADFAQFHSVSAAIDDSMAPMLEILQAVDPTFREIPHQSDTRKTTRYGNDRGFQVEFLTPNRGSDDHQDKPSKMPALGGASAIALRFLDFLIYEPQRSVLLHKYGVGITVPAPERYAVHKLIVAARRQGADTIKRQKDVWQAGLLIECLMLLHMGELLADALHEAMERGPAWKQAIADGLKISAPATKETISRLARGSLQIN